MLTWIDLGPYLNMTPTSWFFLLIGPPPSPPAAAGAEELLAILRLPERPRTMPESQEDDDDDDDVDEREAEVERFIAVVLVSSQNIYGEKTWEIFYSF